MWSLIRFLTPSPPNYRSSILVLLNLFHIVTHREDNICLACWHKQRGQLRAVEMGLRVGVGVWLAHGIKKSTPPPLYHLAMVYLQHRKALLQGTLILTELADCLAQLDQSTYWTPPPFKCSLISKISKKYLGADRWCQLCVYKDIKKLKKHFLPPTPLFHKRHFNTKNIKRYKEHFRIIQRPLSLINLALICYGLAWISGLASETND